MPALWGMSIEFRARSFTRFQDRLQTLCQAAALDGLTDLYAASLVDRLADRVHRRARKTGDIDPAGTDNIDSLLAF